ISAAPNASKVMVRRALRMPCATAVAAVGSCATADAAVAHDCTNLLVPSTSAMRLFMLTSAALLFLAVLPVGADKSDDAHVYQIDLLGRGEQGKVRLIPHQGKLLVQIQFRIKRLADSALVNDVPKDEIVLREDGRPVEELEIHQPAGAEPLAAVLAMDISGSMANGGKRTQGPTARGKFA